MTSAIPRPRALALGWPLGISVVATTIVAAMVCSPPAHRLHSWGQILTLATAYVLLAAAVHALAVWSVCRVREASEAASWRVVLSVIWAAWLVVVWLPLLALLTAEHSPWVSLILPVTVVFAVLLLRWRSARAAQLEEELLPVFEVPRELFALDADRSLWRTLLPAVGTALALQLGCAMLAADHGWTAGCLLGAAAIYPLERWPGRRVDENARRRASSRAATANSLVVWLLLVLALMPFMATYAAGLIAGLVQIDVSHGRPIGSPKLGRGAGERGFVGLILTPPPVPHEIVAPVTTSASSTLEGKPQVIPFDGAYWYFKAPDTDPGPAPHIQRGDPVKNRVLSTDHIPLLMEAHQKLARPLDTRCCAALRVDVTNADTVAGPIYVQVILQEAPTAKSHVLRADLGQEYLKTSLVSPMPLKRPPVEDSVRFALPSYLHGRSVTGITVRIVPGRLRALAGPQVAIKDFALER